MNSRTTHRQLTPRRPAWFEVLEARWMLAASVYDSAALTLLPQPDWAGPHLSRIALATSGGTGEGSVSSAVPPALTGAYVGPMQANGLPILNSNPGAPAAIYINFEGYAPRSLLAYSEDADATTYNAAEQSTVYECWRHIVTYFSMFNLNVTTVNPSVPKAYSIVSPSISGGWAWVNTFPSNEPMAHNESGDARTRQSGIAHEIGHVFGLGHIADFDTLGNKVNEYSSGFDQTHGPIMGVDYAQNVHKWFIGHNSGSPSTLQDDIAKIISQIKRFDTVTDGFHADDFTDTIATATPMDARGAGQVATGVIERMADVDAFSFTTTGGKVDIDLSMPYPSALDAELELYDSTGARVASVDGNSTSTNAQLLQPTLAAGTYYLLVSSHGSYGDLGVYDLGVRPVPSGWNSADLGTVQVAGYTEYDSTTSTFTNAGSGSDVYGTADGAHFAYQKITGDVTIIARVTQIQGTDPWAKVGLDIRESLAAGAKHADMVISYSSGPQFAYRTTTNGSTTSVNGTAAAFTPIWLKLVRSGNTITGYRSTNGTTWTQQGTISITMTSPVYVGLLTTSHSSRKLNVSQFTNVSIAGAVAPGATYNSLPAPAGLTLTLGTGTGVTASWNAVATATGYALERSPDNVNWTSVTNTASGVLTYTDPSPWGSMRYYYRVAARDASGNSVPSAAVSIINRPNAVTNAAVTSWTETKMILNWRDVSGETGYRVERSPDGTTYTTLTTLAANVPSYTDTVTGANTVFTYRVTPVSALGDGPAATFQGSSRLPVVPGIQISSVDSTSIGLAWTDITGETNYKVARSGDGTTFSTVSQTIAADSTGYTHTGVTPLTENYYRVTGRTSLTESIYPTVVFAASKPATPLPAPWATTDIGSVRGAGATGVTTGTYKLISSGSDIGGTSDSFHFAYQPLVGNGSIVARVASVENTASSAKVGIMIRESLAANSRNVMIAERPSGGVIMQSRSSNGGSTSSTAGPTTLAPYWLKLERSGNSFTASTSPDGTTWTVLNTVTVSMGTSAYIGLCADAASTTLLNTSTIDNLTISNSAPTVANAASASPATVTGSTTNLAVLGADDHGESNLIYTWAVTTKPTGAADPTFSVNGGNSAKSTVATFTRAGAYTFTVTVTDTGGLTTTSSVNVTVSQTVTAVSVSPASPTVNWGQTQQFTATATDQFGQPFVTPPTFTWTVTGTGNTVAAGLVTAKASAGTCTVTASASGISGQASLTVNATLASRLVFYNNSAWDGSLAANASDDAAIATNKSALLPGQTATFAHYTSYSRGINGIIVDVGGLKVPASLSAADFTFKAGNSSTPSTWASAPAPAAILVRSGAGSGGSYRVHLTWADNAIARKWLQVTVLPTSNTGLAAPDVFYFGNAIGETGNNPANASVDVADELLARANGTGLGSASLVNGYDFNRDKRVDTQDQLLARANRSGLSPLLLITAPVTGGGSALSAGSGSEFDAAVSVFNGIMPITASAASTGTTSSRRDDQADLFTV